MRLVFILTLWMVAVDLSLSRTNSTSKDQGQNLPGKTTAQIIRLRGFAAWSYNVTTTDGFVINVVKATNPWINKENCSGKKSIVLFIHGTVFNANSFLVNSIGVKPKDYSKYNVSSMDEYELRELLRDDPSQRSLPFLLLNFCYEVWLVNRRGTQPSLGRTSGLKATDVTVTKMEPSSIRVILEDVKFKILRVATHPEKIHKIIGETLTSLMQSVTSKINSDYWTWCMDEQARYDIPEVIEFIRKKSQNRTISLVGHSAGGALILMALTEHPDLAESVNEVLLWAPATQLGHTKEELLKYSVMLPVLRSYVGPFLPMELLPVLTSMIENVCSIKSAKNWMCKLVVNALYGWEGPNQIVRPSFFSALLSYTSYWELSQLVQAVKFGGVQHYMDYGTEELNLAAYGSAEPPPYNYSLIRSKKITLFTGVSDALVSPQSAQAIVNSLSVPAEHHIISDEYDFFNHISFICNENSGPMLNIPSLMKLSRGL